MEMSAHAKLLQVALQAAVEASGAIMTIYREGFSPEFKSDGSPVTRADFASNEILSEYLEATKIPLLTEENEHASWSERRHWKLSWCVDPLDGTKEFLKRNDEFAVCIALIDEGKPVLGVIAAPVEERILIGGREIPPAIIPFSEIENPGNWQFLEPKQSLNVPLVVAGSRSRHAGATLGYLNYLKQKFSDISFIQKGSALKFFDLALGYADVYPRFAPTMEWDIAAGQAIIEALGGKALYPETDRPLTYNKESLYNSSFVIKTKAFIEAEKYE